MIQKILLIISLALLGISCGHRRDAKKFEKLLEANSGNQYSIEKLHTLVGDYVVYKNEATGQYEAYNMEKFDRKEMTSYRQFANVAQEGVDIVKNLLMEKVWVESGYYEDVYEYVTYYDEEYNEDCECWEEYSWTESYWVGTQWVDTSHYDYYYYGGGFKFNNAVGASKDLEMLAAVEEDVAQKFVANELKSKYAFSVDRASQLAELVVQYQRLEGSRELTEAEKDRFAVDALGVNLTELEEAIKEKARGKQESYRDLLKTAAQVNNISPESMSEMFEKLELNEVVDL